MCIRDSYRCPDKYPRARIKTISDAGRLNIPWTSGILIGIGETWEERVDSIFELKRINDEFGHIQEIIIQNFSPKPGIKMEGSPVPTDLDMIKTVAISKILMGEKYRQPCCLFPPIVPMSSPESQPQSWTSM